MFIVLLLFNANKRAFIKNINFGTKSDNNTFSFGFFSLLNFKQKIVL